MNVPLKSEIRKNQFEKIKLEIDKITTDPY